MPDLGQYNELLLGLPDGSDQPFAAAKRPATALISLCATFHGGLVRDQALIRIRLFVGHAPGNKKLIRRCAERSPGETTRASRYCFAWRMSDEHCNELWAPGKSLTVQCLPGLHNAERACLRL